MKTILVSGASGILGYGILKSLQQSNISYKLIGTSIYDDSIAPVFCDIFEKALRTDDSNVCSIGFSEKDNKWYGWSHRAIYGFKIGDVVKKGDCCALSGLTEEYLKKHPEEDCSLPIGFKAKSLADCKKMAIAFADSVS